MSLLTKNRIRGPSMFYASTARDQDFSRGVCEEFERLLTTLSFEFVLNAFNVHSIFLNPFAYVLMFLSFWQLSFQHHTKTSVNEIT